MPTVHGEELTPRCLLTWDKVRVSGEDPYINTNAVASINFRVAAGDVATLEITCYNADPQQGSIYQLETHQFMVKSIHIETADAPYSGSTLIERRQVNGVNAPPDGKSVSSNKEIEMEFLE